MAFSTGQKSLYALAATVAAYLLAYRASVTPEGSRATGIAALFVLLGMCVGSVICALLALRELWAKRRANPSTRTASWPGWVAGAALVMTFLFVAAFGSGMVLAYAKPAAAPGWASFTSPSGDFTVSFPEPPEETTQPLQRSSGPVTMHSFTAVGPAGQGYTVMTGDFLPEAPTNLPAELDRLVASFVERSGGKLVSRAETSSGATPGRQLRVDTDTSSMRVRLFAVGQRVYQVLALRPTTSGEDGLDTRFLESFKLNGP